ncbi:hypothetical protein EO244_09885 [Ancylomarina salipaludis]|uniref:Uncharacterized protein n=1 Tax=Ancylomarina salipaludis TaxID=2501299 RepID=A0A4Q1JKQ2_9BACT|nr:hypothetical protein [Ancylomarina salipaludis]RXQ93880.1 hypothetical protein EO244_09885 [Ancylomarina salipaludis]
MTIEKLQNIVLQALEFGQNGKTKACNEHLRLIYSSLQANPLLLWESSQVSQLGKSIILMLHLDLIDDEEKNIGLTLLAYLFLSKGIQNEEKMPETDICELFRIRKDRIILLKSFDDFFVDSLQEIYFANEKPANREAYNEQRKAVLSRVPLMQFSDIFDIEQDYPNLRDDEFLLETANYIEMEDEITSDNLREANLLHKTLFKYELQRLKEGKMNY